MLAYASQIAAQLNISNKHVVAVLQLLAESATIPFIARYRKDLTGNLDEVQILQIQDAGKQLKELHISITKEKKKKL